MAKSAFTDGLLLTLSNRKLHYRVCEAIEWHHKYVSDARLLLATVLTYPVY